MAGHLEGIEEGEEGEGDLASKGMTEEQLHAAVEPLALYCINSYISSYILSKIAISIATYCYD